MKEPATPIVDAGWEAASVRPSISALTRHAHRSRMAHPPASIDGLITEFSFGSADDADCILHAMTRALDAAIAKLSELPAEEQDRIARWLLDELADEEAWACRFASSQDALSKLAAEARADLAAGRGTELDPDKL
jgi:hypothetical protein